MNFIKPKDISMKTAISLIKSIYDQGSSCPVRSVIEIGKGNVLTMVAADEDLMITKILNFFPSEKRPISGIILCSNIKTGEIIGVLDAEYVTKLRTGATTGYATDLLADQSATTLGIIGAGEHAYQQIQGVLSVRDIKKIKIYDKDWFKAELLSKKIKHSSVCRDVNSLVSHSDILITCTTSKVPVFDSSYLKEKVHINAVGAFKSTDRELDDGAVTPNIVVDDITAGTSGDIALPMSKGLIKKITNLKDEKGENSEDRTVFKSVGSAIQDLAIVKELLK